LAEIPSFVAQPNVGFGTVYEANTYYRPYYWGTDNLQDVRNVSPLVKVFQAGPNGSLLYHINLQPLGTNAASIVRLFLSSPEDDLVDTANGLYRGIITPNYPPNPNYRGTLVPSQAPNPHFRGDLEQTQVPNPHFRGTLEQETVPNPHFRGTHANESEILLIDTPVENDFAYNEETSSIWTYVSSTWTDSTISYPDGEFQEEVLGYTTDSIESPEDGDFVYNPGTTTVWLYSTDTWTNTQTAYPDDSYPEEIDGYDPYSTIADPVGNDFFYHPETLTIWSYLLGEWSDTEKGYPDADYPEEVTVYDFNQIAEPEFNQFCFNPGTGTVWIYTSDWSDTTTTYPDDSYPTNISDLSDQLGAIENPVSGCFIFNSETGKIWKYTSAWNETADYYPNDLYPTVVTRRGPKRLFKEFVMTATTDSATAALANTQYQLNFKLQPNLEIYAAVTVNIQGIAVTVVGGDY